MLDVNFYSQNLILFVFKNKKKMKVHVMCYGGSPIGVFSSKTKLLRTYVLKCKTYKDEIISDLKNALEGKYRSEYDELQNMDNEKIQEILNLFIGESYNPEIFTYSELREATDSDYIFYKFEINV